MPQLSLPCPHCHSEKIGFSPRGAVPVNPGVAQTLLFLQCEGCGEAVTAVISNGHSHVNNWVTGHTNSPGSILKIYPAAAADAAPSDIPPQVAAAYLSGLDNLKRKGGTNAAAIMFRRTVEIALKTMPSPPFRSQPQIQNRQSSGRWGHTGHEKMGAPNPA